MIVIFLQSSRIANSPLGFWAASSVVSFDPWFFIPALRAVDNECASKRRDGNGKLKPANLEPFSSLRFFFFTPLSWVVASFLSMDVHQLYIRDLIVHSVWMAVNYCLGLSFLDAGPNAKGLSLHWSVFYMFKASWGARQYQPSDLINFIRGAFIIVFWTLPII